jgi:periplasmic divalent cation tolerance protein
MSVDLTRARVVLITHPPEGVAEFVQGLVESGIAACVSSVAVRSVYRWQGAVEDAEEVLLVAKTRVERLEDLERYLSDEHPYDVPELVALQPAHVGAGYLEWLLGETATGGDG